MTRMRRTPAPATRMRAGLASVAPRGADPGRGAGRGPDPARARQGAAGGRRPTAQMSNESGAQAFLRLYELITIARGRALQGTIDRLLRRRLAVRACRLAARARVGGEYGWDGDLAAEVDAELGRLGGR
jgi:hypothetical protein